MKLTQIAALLGSTALFTVTQLAIGVAWAQDTETNDSPDVTVLDTIYVSGENITRSLQQTATSVEILTSEDLDARPDEPSIQSAIKDIPNIYIPGTSGIAPVIRGLDSQGPNNGGPGFFSGVTPRAAINIDGHYQSYYESVFGATSVWDLDQIEVFRGPQTTSQGANSIAGAILVKTKDPTFTPEGAFQAEYGSYNTHRLSGMLSGPLSQQLAARIAVDYYGRDTFIDYVNSAFTDEYTNHDIMSFNGRAKLLFVPENSGLEAKLTYALTQSNQPTYEASTVTPLEDYNNDQTSVPTFYTRTHTGIADLSYEFDNGIRVSNQTQYSSLYMHRSTENYTFAGVTERAGDARIQRDNVSNEILVNFGSQDTKFSGVAGVFASYAQSDESLLWSSFGSPVFDDTKTNLGVFGEADYRITDALTLTGAVRFESDQVKRSGQSSTTATRTTLDFDYDKTFSAVLPKVALAYDITPDVTVGGLINRGFNPGGVTYDFAQGIQDTFKEETSWNYELFGRANLLDDKLFISGNLFYTDYTDHQLFYYTVMPNTGLFQALTLNAEKAHAYGLEIAAGYQVLDNLRLNANAGLIRTEITQFDDMPADVGNEFAETPGYSFGLGVDWTLLDKLTLSANIQHYDGYYSDLSNTADLEVDSYTIANARAIFQVHDNFQIHGYVTNIFDERVPTYLENRRDVANFARMTAPRMFGIGAKATF